MLLPIATDVTYMMPEMVGWVGGGVRRLGADTEEG